MGQSLMTCQTLILAAKRRMSLQLLVLSFEVCCSVSVVCVSSACNVSVSVLNGMTFIGGCFVPKGCAAALCTFQCPIPLSVRCITCHCTTSHRCQLVSLTFRDPQTTMNTTGLFTYQHCMHTHVRTGVMQQLHLEHHFLGCSLHIESFCN